MVEVAGPQAALSHLDDLRREQREAGKRESGAEEVLDHGELAERIGAEQRLVEIEIARHRVEQSRRVRGRRRSQERANDHRPVLALER